MYESEYFSEFQKKIINRKHVVYFANGYHILGLEEP
jgi:hypothetical protein